MNSIPHGQAHDWHAGDVVSGRYVTAEVAALALYPSRIELAKICFKGTRSALVSGFLL